MKNVILSADGELGVYSVPDVVAENLAEYCIAFCNDWLRNSPDAEKYRHGSYVCYNEADFIEYLNTWVFPDEQSEFIKNLGYCTKIPAPYSQYPSFNF